MFLFLFKLRFPSIYVNDKYTCFVLFNWRLYWRSYRLCYGGYVLLMDDATQTTQKCKNQFRISQRQFWQTFYAVVFDPRRLSVTTKRKCQNWCIFEVNLDRLLIGFVVHNGLHESTCRPTNSIKSLKQVVSTI